MLLPSAIVAHLDRNLSHSHWMNEVADEGVRKSRLRSVRVAFEEDSSSRKNMRSELEFAYFAEFNSDPLSTQKKRKKL